MLKEELETNEIGTPPHDGTSPTSQAVLNGRRITPIQHLLLISPDEWEIFLVEWAQYQKKRYHLVVRLGGANDHGVDVACFMTKRGFRGQWDNYQCKYYKDEPLAPSTAIPEVGKILWHIFNKNITTPENYYFFAPKDCGPSLKKLLLNSYT